MQSLPYLFVLTSPPKENFHLKFIPKIQSQTNLICSDFTTQWKFSTVMCGIRYMSILRRITNASPLPNSCVLTYHRMKIFFSMCGTRYWSLCYKAANKSIPIESLPNSFVLTSPPNENCLLNHGVAIGSSIYQLCGRSHWIHRKNWISTKLICSDVTTQWKFSSSCSGKSLF